MSTPMTLPLEGQALVVWLAAKTGRDCARRGFRASAVARMESLARVESKKFPSLTRIAHEAARDINLLLSCGPST